MKCTLLTAALLSTASALPSINPFLARGAALAPREALCYANRIDSTTTPDSALATDCTALQGEIDTLFNHTDWTPSDANGFGFDVRSGTCGLSFKYLANTSAIPDTEFRVKPGHAEVILLYTVEQFTVDGKVSSEGAFHCLIGGQFTKSGWGNFAVYKVEEAQGQ